MTRLHIGSACRRRFTLISAGLILQISSSSGAAVQYPEGIHLELVEKVTSAESGAYRAILGEFDEHLVANPDDHLAAVERCRFITNYAYQEEVTIESAYEASEECIRDLTDGPFTSWPEVQLFLLEQEWGEEGIKKAEVLLPASREWTVAHRAALHARLSELYGIEDPDKSGRHATAATGLDPSTGRQIAAAEYQLRIGARRKAIDLIGTITADQWNVWTLQQAVGLLLQAKDPQAALTLVKAKPDITLNRKERFALVRALFDAGEIAAGDSLLREGGREQTTDEADAFPDVAAQRQLFELRRDYGTASDAIAAYQDLRDNGWSADPFAWFRLSLVRTAPAAPWTMRDLAGVGTILLTLGFLALLPGLIVAPIHYRSAIKRLRGNAVHEATNLAPWNLRQMWYAIAAIIVLMTLASYVFAYAYFENLVMPAFGTHIFSTEPADVQQLGRAFLWGSTLSLIAMTPLVRRTTLRALFAGNWSITRALLVGAGSAFGFLFVAAILKGLMAWGGLAIGPGSETFRGMQGINENHGPLMLLVFACVMTPVLEEFVFRGVVLRTSARHLALWAAVGLQAVVFVIWHEDVGDYPVLLLFAVGAAWLAMRSGGLLAPMAFHAVVNLVAVSVLLRFGEMIRQGG